MTKIEEFLRTNLTAMEYGDLRVMLGVKQTKFSRLMSGTDEFKAEHIKTIMQLTKQNEPYFFILEHEIKNNISVDELTDLMNFFENKELKTKLNYAKV